MRRFKKYGITLLAGFLIVAAIAWAKDLFGQSNPQMVFHILSDAFFVAGILITAAGLLIFSSNEGSFDMLVYGVNSFVDMFRRNSRKKYDTYFDYKESRAGKQIKFGFLLLCGLFFLAVAVVMYLLYRRYV